MKFEDEFFRTDNISEVWQRYCGFLSLSIEEFRLIQDGLLMEQIEKVFNRQAFKELVPVENIKTIAQFRSQVPLRRYPDYEPYFRNDSCSLTGDAQFYWVHTSASKGTFKKAPWTLRFHEVQCRDVISALILSSAKQSGDVNVLPGCRIMNLLPSRPFVSASLAFGIQERFTFKAIPSIETSEELPFMQKIDNAVTVGLQNDVDFVIAMTSSLLKIGPRFSKVWDNVRRSPRGLLTLYPRVAWRLIRNDHREDILPKTAWNVKGIICWGADSGNLEKTVEKQWGKKPMQMYGSTEGGIMAMQDWTKGLMSFLPDSVFFEFIPEELINSSNPSTVLIDEVENGKVYELVLTSFYGMPLVRYRQGDLVKISKDLDKANGVPRMEFIGRADDTIDLFGISRLNTEVVTQAMASLGLSENEWCVRKEFETEQVLLRFYIELDKTEQITELEKKINHALKATDRHWAEAVYTMAYNPIRVTVVPKGAFTRLKSIQNYTRQIRINPPDSLIEGLTHSIEAETWNSA